MKTSYFLDTYAIIEFLRGNKNYQSLLNEETFLTSTNNLSEFKYYLLKENLDKDSKKIISDLGLSFIEITPEVAVEAADFRYKHKKKKLSFIDCLGYLTALKNNLVFLTGDKEFENFQNVRFVK